MARNYGQTVQRVEGLTGVATEPRTSQFNPQRLAANGLINIDAGAESGPWAVTLLPITVPGAPYGEGAAGGPNWRDVAAFVRWGEAGAQSTALVDWPARGGTFVVAGRSLYVDAWLMNPDPALPTVPQFQVINLGAFAVPLAAVRGSPLPPRRTLFATQAAGPEGQINGATSSAAVWIPSFARRFRFYWNNNISTSAAWAVQFLWRQGGVSKSQDLLLNSGARSVYDEATNPLDVPSWAETVVVNNITVAPNTINQARLSFDLDLS